MNETGLRSLERPHSLSEAAVEAIRSAIVCGQLSPGQRVSEMGLASQLGISRGPVREALKELELEGLVTSTQRGTFVSKLSVEDVRELYTLREALDPVAIRLAMPRLTSEDLTCLQGLVERMVSAVERASYLEALELDEAFHRLIYIRAAHRRLLRIWDVLANTVRVAMIGRISEAGVVGLPTGHQAILSAIRARDAAAAEHCAWRHAHESGKTRIALMLSEGESQCNQDPITESDTITSG